MTSVDTMTTTTMRLNHTMSIAKATLLACCALVNAAQALLVLFQGALEKFLNSGPKRRGDTEFVESFSAALVVMACTAMHSGTAKATTMKLTMMNLFAMVGYEEEGNCLLMLRLSAASVKNKVRFILSLFPKFSAGIKYETKLRIMTMMRLLAEFSIVSSFRRLAWRTIRNSFRLNLEMTEPLVSTRFTSGSGSPAAGSVPYPLTTELICSSAELQNRRMRKGKNKRRS